jgi:hypothetical protein
VLVFFDDILIYSASWVEHLQHVGIVLEALQAHHLHLKRSKCSFGATSVAILAMSFPRAGSPWTPTRSRQLPPGLLRGLHEASGASWDWQGTTRSSSKTSASL